MTPSTRAIAFYHTHLGQRIAPNASPIDSIAPSLPTRTKKAREARQLSPTAPLDVRRIGTGMPVFYIVTEDHSWLLSNTEPPEHPDITSVRIDDEDGKSAIAGNQYIAHWLFNEAPIDRPFLVGSIEKANPVPSLRLSSPPLQAHYCTTSSKTGTLTIHLQDYRDDIEVVRASGIPWTDVRKGLQIKKALAVKSVKGLSQRPGYDQARQEDPLRKNMKKLQKKHPDLLTTLSALQVMSGSPNEIMMTWYFANDNAYGKR